MASVRLFRVSEDFVGQIDIALFGMQLLDTRVPRTCEVLIPICANEEVVGFGGGGAKAFQHYCVPKDILGVQ